jgi:hypothetical protein
MRCISCNKELTTRESVHKDNTTGEFHDMCGRCLGESMKALAIAEAFTRDAQDPQEPQEAPRSSKDPLAVFEEMVHTGGYWDQWAEGLGLMTPTARRIMLYNKAKDRFTAAIANGDRLNIALDLAFKRMPKRNAIGYHDVGETIESDLTGEPIHGKIIK